MSRSGIVVAAVVLFALGLVALRWLDAGGERAAPRARSLQSLSVYEPPLHLDRGDAAAFSSLDAAVEAGHPDLALETFFPVADITAAEIAMVRSQDVAWQALRAGVMIFPREHRALHDEGPAMFAASVLPDVPMLYLSGELTTAPVYPSARWAEALWPHARLRCLPGQRHLAPIFDPAAFAATLLEFTNAQMRDPRSGS